MTRAIAFLLAVGMVIEVAHAQQKRAPAPPRNPRLFAPQDLGLLEPPDREAWQKPYQVMDTLNVADGTKVVDLGAGGGWFTVRLARRVGPYGRVYAVDVQRLMIEAIQRRVQREGYTNVTPVHGDEDDPRLPADALVDAVLIVDAFPEMRDPVTLPAVAQRRHHRQRDRPGGHRLHRPDRDDDARCRGRPDPLRGGRRLLRRADRDGVRAGRPA
jgi:SAM-dependent methyltransferase